MIRRFEISPLTEVAPLLDQSAESMIAEFESAGFTVRGAGESVTAIAAIAAIAANNDTEPKALAHLLFNRSG